MKKTYISPSMKAHKVKHAQMICGSGKQNAVIQSPDEETQSSLSPTPTEKTYGNTPYTGIFGD